MRELTECQLEVLRLTAAGMNNKEIAYKLGICSATVSAHINHIKYKLAAETRGQMIVHAIALKLISLPKRTEIIKRINQS